MGEKTKAQLRSEIKQLRKSLRQNEELMRRVAVKLEHLTGARDALLTTRTEIREKKARP